MRLKDLLDLDMGSAADWLEENSEDFYLVPKGFITGEEKDLVQDEIIAIINNNAPACEVLDSVDHNLDMLVAINRILEEDFS